MHVVCCPVPFAIAELKILGFISADSNWIVNKHVNFVNNLLT